MLYKKLVLSLVALCSLTLSGMAQAPDYTAIKDSTEDISSRFYYPLLMDRYRLADTTLTSEDYRYLYYGYPESANYRPLLQNSYSDSLSMAFGTRTAPTAQTYYRVIRLCKVILEQEPFNLRDMNALAFAYSQLGDTLQALKTMRQIEMVVGAIKSTGSGESEQSPWYITYYNHAEDILNMMEVAYRRPIILTRTIEMFPVDKMAQKMKVKGYYFDFAPIYFKRPDYLEDPDVKTPKRKLEFNPLYNPKSKLNTLSPPKK